MSNGEAVHETIIIEAIETLKIEMNNAIDVFSIIVSKILIKNLLIIVS